MALMLCCAMTMFAQNDKISYQAVVRGTDNHLVVNTALTVTVSLANSEDGAAVYTETHAVTSNMNGLISLLIGDGTPVSGDWADVQWGNAWVTADIARGGTHIATHKMPLSAVPYALQAGYADSVNTDVIAHYLATHPVPGGEANVQSDWSQNDNTADDYIKNKPTIPDAQIQSDWNQTTTTAVDYIKNKPTLANVATSGNYNDLTNKPTFADVATTGNYSDLNGTPNLATVATTGSYSDLNGTPAINNATLTIKQGEATLGTFTANASEAVTVNVPVPASQVNADWNASTGAAQILNKPTNLVTTDGDNNFTGTVTVPSAGINLKTDGATSCSNRNAVNACDLLAAFDSLNRRIQGVFDSLKHLNDSLAEELAALKPTTLTLTSNRDVNSANLCGDASVEVVYTATLSNADIADYTFTWTVGGEAQSETGSTLTHTYTAAATDLKVVCVATREGYATLKDSLTTTTTCTVSSRNSNEMGSSATVIDSVKDHEGNWYEVVQIGNQCWLKENLRTTTSPKTGTRLVNTAGKTGNSSSHYYGSKVAHWYMNDSTTYAPKGYGLLYNWCAVMDTANPTNHREVPTTTEGNDNYFNFTPSGNHRGICPEGWHVPTDAEWSAMELEVNGSDVSSTTGYRGRHAGKLSTGCDWTSSTAAGAPGNYSNVERNSSGFAAVPAGYFYSSFHNAGSYAYFWSSSQNYSAGNQNFSAVAWYRYLTYNGAGVYRNAEGYVDKYYGRSVRCVRD